MSGTQYMVPKLGFIINCMIGSAQGWRDLNYSMTQGQLFHVRFEEDASVEKAFILLKQLSSRSCK